MPARLAKGVITPRNRYVCPLCRPHISSLARGQKWYQHTRPPANVDGDTNQEVIPKDMSDYGTSTSRTSIADTIRAYIFKPDEKDKESKGDSKYGSHEPPPVVSKITHSTAPQPKPSTNIAQRKLQEKFAAQRRKDMLAMQASQGLRGAEETKDVSKAPRVPESIKQKPKKRSVRAARVEKREWKLQQAALAKKAKEQNAIERSKQAQAKLIDLAKTEVARIATSTKPQAAAQLPTDIEASGAEDQKANENDSAGKASKKQRAISQKLDDIMNILDTSKDAKKPEDSAELVKRPGEMETKSTDIELQRVVTAVLKELQNRGGGSLDNDRRNAIALLKSNSEDTSQSSKLKILAKRASRKDPVVRKVESDRLPFLLRKYRARPRLRRYVAMESKQYPEGIKSLRAALMKGHFDKAGARHKLRSEKDQRTALKNQRLEKARSRIASHSGKAQKTSAPLKAPVRKTRMSKRSMTSSIEMSTASNLELTPVMVEQPPVPRLAYGLERVLFNPGVYQLQDPRSRVYNFDPYLQKIMPVEEFDFNALKEYITSSRDESLNKLAKEHGKRYMGSTSSMTVVLAHFHYLLSQWRPINTSMLSKAFPATMHNFTEIQRTPSAIILRWKNGSYAIDADKEFASANVLSMLGKSMEKFLTLSMQDFERYRKSNPGQVTEDERFAPESYHYSTLGDFLLRSQLDSHDPRLPGTGMFDLKTRSVVSIRMDVTHYEHGIGYEIMDPQGQWESYEREYYDMIRSAFLKYSLQVRMGRMDGIFVAFHNIERIFGFQYISLPEMDYTIHGQRDTSIGDQEFRLSLDLMNKILDRATKKYPETSLRIFFETREASTNFMYIFAEPVTEEQVAEIQSQNDAEIQEFERNILGLTRGKGSDADDAPEIDPKWEKIQSDVQKAMEEDELFENESGIDEGTEGLESNSNRPEVFEQGPSSAKKSASGADDGADAVSAGHEEDECENEEEDEDEGDQDDLDGNRNRKGDVEESRRQEGLNEFFNDEAEINAADAVKAEHTVDGAGTEQNNVALSDDCPVKVQSTTNVLGEEPNEDDTPSAISRQQGNKAEPITNAEGEGQQEHQTRTGQPLPGSINEEVVQADTPALPSASNDFLAMTLTLRNKVNGEYVHRPETMSAADEWSIEYSLTDMSERRARVLYNACQLRRKKKLEKVLVSDEQEAVPGFIQNLRALSRKGRNWRKEQDKMDEERPVQVLSEKEGRRLARSEEAET